MNSNHQMNSHFQKVVISDNANKLKSLISKLKTDIPTLKFALNGGDYERFGCTTNSG